MKLLFITQKLSGQDSFGVLWVNAFRTKGYDVTVLCLEGSEGPFEFPVHSLEKEKGVGKMRQVVRFWKRITNLQYDRVFIHMAPVWYALGFWWWLFNKIPVYLWYTHYTMQLGVWLFGLLGKRFFCATAQSLPQFAGNPKKVVTGHGIDLRFWPKRENRTVDGRSLLMVHRLSRSKRVELSLEALALLPEPYTLEIFGFEAEPHYVRELHARVSELQLSERVRFHGTIPMEKLPAVYASHRLILNMASATIDKTMLEAMTCGCTPVTTHENADAIGIAASPIEDTPRAIASFIETYTNASPMPAEEMYRVVAEKHSLGGLIATMDRYMREGI